MKKLLLLGLLTFLFQPKTNFACSCLLPSSFCESITDEEGKVWVNTIVRGKVLGDGERGAKRIEVQEVILGNTNRSEIDIMHSLCVLFFNEIEDGAEYIFAMHEFNNEFLALNCAIYFLKIENEVVKGKIAPGIESMNYKDLGDLQVCGSAFESIGFGGKISVFPNPTHDFLQLKNSSENQTFGNLQLKAYDMLGREIANFSNQEGILPEETWEINIRHLAAGVYIFQLSGRGGERVFRIVKQGV